MAEGWIKLHRQIQDNKLWTCEPFTRGQAWVDLIIIANHKRNYFYLRDHKIEVERGQVGWSQLKLSTRWKWSRSKVKKFLNDLEKEQQIKQQVTQSTTIIEILNYEAYQEKEQQDAQQKDNRKTTEEQQKSTNKNEKNEKKEKNDKEDNTSTHVAERFYLTSKKKKLTGKRLETFETFWEFFNYKKSKSEAAQAWLDIPSLTVPLCEEIYAAAKREASIRPSLVASGKTPKMGQGWITSRRWEDEEISATGNNKLSLSKYE